MNGGTRAGCPVITELTVQELSRLNAVERPGQELVPVNWCDLGPDHGGLWHYTLCQQGGMANDQEWWLRWNDHTRELLVMPGCETRGPSDDLNHPDGALCLLFDQHPGQHSFDATAIASAMDWNPQLTVGQLRAALAGLGDDTPIRLAAAKTGAIAESGEVTVVDTVLAATNVRGNAAQRRQPVAAEALVLIADHASNPVRS